MKRALVVATLVLFSAIPAAAQTKGRISVGGTVTFVQPTDSEVGSLVGFGGLVQAESEEGVGRRRRSQLVPGGHRQPSYRRRLAKLRVRPLMGGVSYTIGEQPVLVSFSIVAGPSFNDLDFDDDFLKRCLPDRSPTSTSRTALPSDLESVSTWTVAERVAIIGFGGYSYNRPDLVYRDVAGREYRNQWKADAILLSVGAVYSLF